MTASPGKLRFLSFPLSLSPLLSTSPASHATEEPAGIRVGSETAVEKEFCKQALPIFQISFILLVFGYWEIDDPFEEWVPESLHPPITEDMKAEPPILESSGYVFSASLPPYLASAAISAVN
ncbi:hypothetical protein Cni_G28127 [Canna indica]|uniref:Uncharacterized protein n=1 Tax=Canna indica TaxID=4628 RepID=A0AAQ3L2X6_9LILI|nr:hypothetical protein Cni_G28127 [Canna indica]